MSPKKEEELEEEEVVIEEEPEEKTEAKPKVVKVGGLAPEEIEAVAENVEFWMPKTKLGEMVKKGEMTSLSDVIHSNMPLKEVEIIDSLMPELQEEILSVGRVQRVTDSGRRMRFRVVTAVGNGNGYVGVGAAKGKEAGPTIRKSIERAKLSIKEVKRGCGSWECGCGLPHTVPFKVEGTSGSVTAELLPAPRGVGLISGEISKKILALAGISDVWANTSGHTRTSYNFAFATFNALVNTNFVKVRQSDIKNLKIISGALNEGKE